MQAVQHSHSAAQHLEKPNGRRAIVTTVGCRLNQSESLLIRDKLIQNGYEIVKESEPCDLCIINTCTVTDRADSKCRATIRSLIRKNPTSVIVVAGCYSQMGYREIASIQGVDVILGNQCKLDVLDYVDGSKNETALIVRDRIDREDFSIVFVGDHTYNKRANLKIQDGCDFFCSFCIIPHARGRARSREWTNLLDEAHSLAARGVKELVLTGVNIGTYQSGGRNVLDVIDALNEVPGITRLRVSSIEPTTISEAIFERMNDPGHALLPFFHVPLQSGSDRILEAMRRKYTVREYFEFMETALKAVPHAYFGTDIMVGFPGETEMDFQESCSRFLEAPFAFAHVFTYSERKGTPAKRITESVPMEERQRRSLHFRRLSQKKRYDYYRQHLNSEVEVLIEDPKPTLWTGLTDNYIRVCFPRDPVEEDLTNRLVRVKLVGQDIDFVEGKFIKLLD